MGVHPDSLWRTVGHYVNRAHNSMDVPELEHIGIDECSREKGHKYFTVFGDLDLSRVIFVADTRQEATIKQLLDFLNNRGGRQMNIDPGIVSLSNITLASTKNYSHRIYLGN